MMGMQGKKMAEATREIIDTVRGLQKDTHKFADSLNVLNTHITHTKSAFDRVATDYASITGKIERLDRVDEDNLLE